MWRTETEAFSGNAVASAVARARRTPLAPGGVWLPMVTPMRAGRVDLARAGDLATRYAAAGVDGLIVLGTTGEGSLLSMQEGESLVAVVLEAVGGLMPVMAGAGAIDTRDVVAQIAQLGLTWATMRT